MNSSSAYIDVDLVYYFSWSEASKITIQGDQNYFVVTTIVS